MYKNYHDSLLTSVNLKLKESNKTKSNLKDPHSRTVIIPEIHKLVFAGEFSPRFLPTKRSLDGIDLSHSSPRFTLNTISRVDKVFNGSVAKMHGSGDITVIAPWYHLVNDKYNVGNEEFFREGTLVMPLKVTTM